MPKVKKPASPTGAATTVQGKIAETVAAHDVVLFMKGTTDFPQCGFSAKVVGILKSLGTKYSTFNILSDAEAQPHGHQHSPLKGV